MVQINQISFTTDIVNGNLVSKPVLYVHHLDCKKDVATFLSGKRYKCYITKYDNGRFAVFTSSGFISNTHYHVFETADSMHDHFDEVTDY